MNSDLPYDPDAEMAVLGAILLDPESVIDLCIENKLTIDSFFIQAHKTIYRAMGTLCGKNRGIDIRTVSSFLKDHGELERVGGELALEHMINKTVTISYALHYIAIVREKEVLRELRAFVAEAQILVADPENDVAEIAPLLEAKIFNLNSPIVPPKTNEEAVGTFLQTARDAGKGQLPGLPPFLHVLRERMGTYRNGKLYCVGAPPGGGKSTYAFNQLRYWAENGIECGLCSIEMDHEDVVGNIMSEMADVSQFSLLNNFSEEPGDSPGDRLKSVEAQAENFLKLPIHIRGDIFDWDTFASWARSIVRKHNVEGIIVDYLQQMDPGKNVKTKSGWERIASITGRGMRLAKELNIVLIFLSQLSGEGGAHKKPNPFDLFGSSAPEQDSCGIIMLYELDNVWYIDIQKHRGGKVVATAVQFNKPRQRWEELRNRDGLDEF